MSQSRQYTETPVKKIEIESDITMDSISLNYQGTATIPTTKYTAKQSKQSPTPTWEMSQLPFIYTFPQIMQGTMV